MCLTFKIVIFQKTVTNSFWDERTGHSEHEKLDQIRANRKWYLVKTQQHNGQSQISDC